MGNVAGTQIADDIGTAVNLPMTAFNDLLSGNFSFSNIRNINWTGAQSAEDIARQNYNRAIDPTSQWNKSNYQAINLGASQAYNPMGPLGGRVPPSQLSAISNPQVRLAIAGSRGGNRDAVMATGNQFNVQVGQSAAGNLALGGGGTANPIAGKTPQLATPTGVNQSSSISP